MYTQSSLDWTQQYRRNNSKNQSISARQALCSDGYRDHDGDEAKDALCSTCSCIEFAVDPVRPGLAPSAQYCVYACVRVCALLRSRPRPPAQPTSHRAVARTAVMCFSWVVIYAWPRTQGLNAGRVSAGPTCRKQCNSSKRNSSPQRSTAIDSQRIGFKQDYK